MGTGSLTSVDPPPDPLAGLRSYSHIVQEARRLCLVGTVPKATKQKQIAIVEFDPSGGAQRAPGTLVAASFSVAFKLPAIRRCHSG
jgi:hypothetical protein